MVGWPFDLSLVVGDDCLGVLHLHLFVRNEAFFAISVLHFENNFFLLVFVDPHDSVILFLVVLQLYLELYEIVLLYLLLFFLIFPLFFPFLLWLPSPLLLYLLFLLSIILLFLFYLFLLLLVHFIPITFTWRVLHLYGHWLGRGGIVNVFVLGEDAGEGEFFRYRLYDCAVGFEVVNLLGF